MTAAIASIVKRDGRILPFDREKVVVAIYKATAAIGGHDRRLAEELADEVIEALQATYSADLPPTVEDVQDVVERVLIQRGHAKTAKAYIVYRHERAKMRSRQEKGRVEYIPWKAMWHALDWAVAHGCHTVEQLNRIVADGRLPELVRAADERYEAILDGAAEAVLERRGELRFIIVAGPSSSGKTTTTEKLRRRLEAEGLHVVPMTLDNYFFDLELHPRDEFGDYDFETPEALDLNLINEHLAAVDGGRGVDMPVYDFKSGRRLGRTQRFEPEEGTLVLLDTLHGLYDGLSASVPAERKFRLYIETISQLKGPDGRYARWADIRLLRRMIRDQQHRAYDPERTILHWHYVRRSELKHIIPYQGSADYQVNSALAYELLFLKRHLFDHLPAFLDKWRDDERHLDGYIRARRVHDLLAA
ncbi:MAG: ATP cone domain-containing protein, partial [Thermoanaerobaculia bacterium]|nr:ATP cone domain-containing protein [Thermoanaerobaculia bacterium]